MPVADRVVPQLLVCVNVAPLHTAAGSTAVPSRQGAYQDYYTRFAAAVRGEGAFPVPAEEALHTLEVLDAARTSAEQNRVVRA